MSAKVLFKNQDLNFFGPTPLISVNSSVTENNGIVNTVTLEGKIFLPRVGQNDTTIGLNQLVQLENQLRVLFQPNTAGELKVQCGSNGDLSFLKCPSGKTPVLTVKSYNANKTSDNWTFSIDYTVELEFFDRSSDRGNPCSDVPIRSYTDSWELIPEQDVSWYNLEINPTATSDQTVSPAHGKRNSSLRYTLTHRVGAVGNPAPSGTAPAVGAYDTRIYSAPWMNAKSFVHCYLEKTRGGTDPHYPWMDQNRNGMSIADTDQTNQPFHFYNHIRTFNIDKGNGSYEITDTWLVLTKAVSYIEDYTVEYTTDNQYDSDLNNPNPSVTINGTVQGLAISTTGSKVGIPFNGSPTGYLTNGTDTEIRGDSLCHNKIIAVTKAESALYAWYTYVEPYLHTRAVSLASVLRKENMKGTAMSLGAGTGRVSPPGLGPLTPSGVYLNRKPVSKTFGFNPNNGVVSYSYRFIGTPINFMNRIVRLSVSDDLPSDVVNEIFILGRKRGPLLQDTGGSTAKSRTVSIEYQADVPMKNDEISPLFPNCPANSGNNHYKRLMDYVDLMRPILPAGWTPKLISEMSATNPGQLTSMPAGQQTGELYVVSEGDTWDPLTGRLGKTITWKWD